VSASIFHPPPEVSAALTERLLEAMRRHPGASASALAGVLKISKNAIAGRWSRLGREGVLVKCAAGRWRLPTLGERPSPEVDDEGLEFETTERSPSVPAFIPGAWVQHVDRYVRVSTSMFACRRFG
jgi:hypothetical protein